MRTQNQRDAAAAAILAKNEITTRCEAVMQGPATQELIRVLQAGCPRAFKSCRLHHALNMLRLRMLPRKQKAESTKNTNTSRKRRRRRRRKMAKAETPISFNEWIQDGQKEAKR